MLNKKTFIIVSFLVILGSLFALTQFKTLILDSSQEIQIEIKNATIDYSKPYILEGTEKEELIKILNDTKLGPYFKDTDILRDSTISIRLYGKGVKNSMYPIYFYYFINNPKDSKCHLEGKFYSIDEKVISKLHDYFGLSHKNRKNK